MSQKVSELAALMRPPDEHSSDAYVRLWNDGWVHPHVRLFAACMVLDPALRIAPPPLAPHDEACARAFATVRGLATRRGAETPNVPNHMIENEWCARYGNADSVERIVGKANGILNAQRYNIAPVGAELITRLHGNGRRGLTELRAGGEHMSKLVGSAIRRHAETVAQSPMVTGDRGRYRDSLLGMLCYRHFARSVVVFAIRHMEHRFRLGSGPVDQLQLPHLNDWIGRGWKGA